MHFPNFNHGHQGLCGHLPVNLNVTWICIIFCAHHRTVAMKKVKGSNFRIPRNSFTCHWIRIASIVLYLDLQSLPTHVSEAEMSCGVFWSLASKGKLILFLKQSKWILMKIYSIALKFEINRNQHVRNYVVIYKPTQWWTSISIISCRADVH